ncbi:single-stranded-DNA-specific exonuclease RecJ [Halalkalibacterium halodurans]|uniref:Single-stranded-DNA-specific exonuclease RecJ n=1 Tax=Halalkalibacterium halodurans TaxID=86665 RepID=A0A0M0KM61_ALKHA|nr:single-stranded-DNA-specific exonuclease RecJ [Halalkalibacterium halodurans]TPE68728.1 single-stranded-DNA-specific exonuclease RecJ [Halalkalibacterium halodurans]
MLESKARWNVAEQLDERIRPLLEHLHIEPIVAKLLVIRGIDTVEEAKTFLQVDESLLHDPYELDGMEQVVARVRQAIKAEEKILIYGDYDADGVSSTSVMVYTLRELGAQFDYYIPNRFTEGYGPNENALRWAKEEGYQLVITVDTGIAAVHEAEVAKEIGLDFIVTDHHEPPPVLPDAVAIINPKKPGCSYPCKHLAGVGVAFKLAHALLERVPYDLLDLVAIGTIADLVPLTDENRWLAKEGLKAIETTTKPGIQALKKVCGFHEDNVQAEHVGFGIGPRINAAGRLDSAKPAVELLITDQVETGQQLAEQIDLLNKERQAIVSEIAAEAINLVKELYPPEDNHVLVVGGHGWNPGVIGIVASRLVETFYRPTIVLSYDEEKGIAKGSARSIEGFDMFHELSKNRELLPHFGGHPMAAGLTMSLQDVDELRKRMNAQAREALRPEDFIPITRIDVQASVDEISVSTIEKMNALAPYGVGNPEPKVMLTDVKIEGMRKIGAASNHLKVTFQQNGTTLDGVGFHLGHLSDEISPTARVSAVGVLSINEWNGHVKPQLMIEDLAVNEWQLFDWRSARVDILSERIVGLPEEKRLLIAFREQTVQALGLASFNVFDGNDLANIPSMENRYVVLLDPPVESNQLSALFVEGGCPSRIYSIFYQEEDSYFSTNPTREHFRWFYGFLMKQKQFNLHTHGRRLAHTRGWTEETISFMAKVFFELGFVTIKDGVITLVEAPEKKGLDQSRTFRMKQEQATIEQQFVYSSYEELKQWFTRAIQERKIKETIQ